MHVTARFFPICIICAILFAACQQGDSSSPEDPTAQQQSPLSQDMEEYAVYATLIANEFKGEYIKQVLIMDHTDGVSQGLLELNLGEWGITPDKETVDSFLTKNQESNLLKPNLDLALDYQLLTQEEVDESKSEYESGGWEVFNEKYPDSSGFITLSRVGFNADLSEALVYFKVSMYDQLLEGGYYFMVWQDGEWVVDSSYVFNT